MILSYVVRKGRMQMSVVFQRVFQRTKFNIEKIRRKTEISFLPQMFKVEVSLDIKDYTSAASEKV